MSPKKAFTVVGVVLLHVAGPLAFMYFSRWRCVGHWLPYVIGYLFATWVAYLPICWLVASLWIENGGQSEEWERRPGWWLPKIIGLVERALYVGCRSVGVPAFVGVWLVLKTVQHWPGWTKGIKKGGSELSGSSIFSIFLIGNGVSIGYAMVGFYLISEVRRSVVACILVSLAILAAVGCFCVMAARYGKKTRQKLIAAPRGSCV
jgi:hypothetical protein